MTKTRLFIAILLAGFGVILAGCRGNERIIGEWAHVYTLLCCDIANETNPEWTTTNVRSGFDMWINSRFTNMEFLQDGNMRFVFEGDDRLSDLSRPWSIERGVLSMPMYTLLLRDRIHGDFDFRFADSDNTLVLSYSYWNGRSCEGSFEHRGDGVEFVNGAPRIVPIYVWICGNGRVALPDVFPFARHTFARVR